MPVTTRLLTDRVIDPAGPETRISYHPSLLLPIAVASANETTTHQRYSALDTRPRHLCRWLTPAKAHP